MATIKTQTPAAAKKEAAKVQFNLESTIMEAGRTLAVYMTADQDMTNAKRIRDKAKADLDVLAKAMHKAGVKFSGNRRTDVLGQQIYSMLPETVAKATRDNYLSAFKRAVHEGRAFSLNPSRERVKADAKKADIAKPDTKAPKADTPKTPLADVITANFKTLLKNNRPRAMQLLEELEELVLASDIEQD